MNKEKTNIIWGFFASIRLAIVLIIILAASSIIGTVIPQKEAAFAFIRNTNPGIVRFLDTLQIFDMYHSTWFTVVIALLAVNLIACSIDRLPITLKLFSTAPKLDREKHFENIPANQALFIKEKIGPVEEKVAALLKDQYGKIRTKTTEKGSFLYGEKGRYSLFGVYVVHISILFILIGAIIGLRYGFDAYIEIPEGEQTSVVISRDLVNQRPIELGFTVQCESFFIDFYENGMPKEYRSKLNFSVDGKDVKQEDLLVNHPITFNGIRFYQSSYGTIPGGTISLKISDGNNEGQIKSLNIKKGEIISLEENGPKFQVVNIENNLRGMMGPAALVSVKSAKGEDTSFWVFKNIESLKNRFPKEMFQSPRLNPSAAKPYTFYLDGIKTKYKTGLQVNRDPGVPLVWTGFILMMVGLIITFFTSHRKIWIRIKQEKHGAAISIAGRSTKNPVGMERELDHIAGKLNNLFNSKGKL